MSVLLPYSRERFSVPDNIYLIGTMNTADRSIEALDTAFRRRFSFIEVLPDPRILSKSEYSIEELDMAEMLIAINRRLERLLDRDHLIGHSFFLKVASATDPMEALRAIFRDSIIPLLKEYFYNDPAKIGLVLGRAFVEEVDDDGFAFASFDQDAAGRYAERREYRFKSPQSWTAASFQSIYGDQTS